MLKKYLLVGSGIVAIVLIVFLVFVLFRQNSVTPPTTVDGLGSLPPPPPPPPPMPGIGGESIFAHDQKPGKSIVAPLVTLSTGGFLVIHEDANGTPGPIIGFSTLLEAGAHENVEIMLTRTSKLGETLHAMLHSDNGDRKFIATDDEPIRGVDGTIIMTNFLVDEETTSADSEP